jgi:predicted ATPase
MAVQATDGPRRSSFVGRERELLDLAAALQHSERRLVTITGMPGIGKTRLAAELCTMLADECASVFVPLASLSDAADIPAAIDRARRAARASVRMSGAPELLVLDNAEHLPGAAEHVPPLLEEFAHVLVTSVRPLGLPVERVLRLGPPTRCRSPRAGLCG